MPTSPDHDSHLSYDDRLIVRAVSPADIPDVRAYLEAHIETSLFLLSNLSELGIFASSSPMSGNFLLIEDSDALAGVFCLTRKGDLLAQTGGRTDCVPEMLAACREEPFPIKGVIAEWQVANALWGLLTARPGFSPVYRSKSVVYRLGDCPNRVELPAGVMTRALTIADYDAWDPVDRAFHADEGLNVMSDAKRRMSAYRMRASIEGWWGAFADGLLVSTACLNAGYGGFAQVGGVYTRPAFRRRGLAQRVMYELMRHHADRSGLREIVLFAAEQNLAARALYETMGFAERGRFGLFFGKATEDLTPIA